MEEKYLFYWHYRKDEDVFVIFHKHSVKKLRESPIFESFQIAKAATIEIRDCDSDWGFIRANSLAEVKDTLIGDYWDDDYKPKIVVDYVKL